MKTNLTLNIVLLAAVLAGPLAQASRRPYYVDQRGTRVEARSITADEQGNLRVELDTGATTTIRHNNYRYAFVPKPDEVAALEQLFNRGDYARFLENVQAVFNRYRYLGWGGKLAYWQGEAELRRDNPQLARSSFERAERFAINDQQRQEIKMGTIKALLALQEDDEAEKLLQEMKTVREDYAAAFSFSARGQLLARRGRTDEAILELLKTVLLFEPRDQRVAEIRREAREQLLAILEERGDPAYDRIRQLQ